MKVSKLIVCLFGVLSVLASCKKSEANPQPPVKDPENKFRIVGYLFNSGGLSQESASVDFSKITHLNIAFINPDANGNLTVSADLDQVIARAHVSNVKVLFSFGGGDPPAHLKDLVKEDKRAAFIEKLVDLAVKHNFDGIDVDLEGDFIDSNYEAFILALDARVKANNKLLTAAVASWNHYNISDKALARFDFINVMSYDKTGPWNKANPGQHAPYSMAVDDIQLWNVTRKVPAEKISLGLPFYGYCFGTDLPDYMTYKDIVSTYPGSENADQVDVPAKGTVYYNGIPTIKSKVTLAFEKQLGGVMIWQLLQDANDSKSLLKAINEVVDLHNNLSNK
ncbi:glycosyl hydrolase family 18 protein [Solitalea sp. MAHUQ-68]|uniref:chitinase n=1 Tax=Solitalea agri TaxID=2953739 RepID=A0A9X2JGC5_9SPHI|nr:glycosyl hydrolase family 18 protein [Solitalea agri]MCO4294296.1 glycosyl hydrolase family 18 protein [Solitalea agri]